VSAMRQAVRLGRQKLCHGLVHKAEPVRSAGAEAASTAASALFGDELYSNEEPKPVED